VINHIQVSCGIEPIGSPTIIYEDNVVCITQMQLEYVKSNVTKHITLKLFYPHEFQVNGKISILQIKSRNNLTDLFTKSLLYATFSKCVAGIDMCRLRDLQELGVASLRSHLTCKHYIVLFSLYEFCYKSFLTIGFNEPMSVQD
jgi:hypothetical protein